MIKRNWQLYVFTPHENTNPTPSDVILLTLSYANSYKLTSKEIRREYLDKWHRLALVVHIRNLRIIIRVDPQALF
jgi:hypothetical protein